MRTMLFLIILILSVSFCYSQSPKPILKITGTVKEIAMQEIYPDTTDALYITYIKINLTLKNTNSIPVIFLQPNPIVDFAEIVQIDKKDDVLLSKTDGSRSSFALSGKDWKKLKENLDKPIPPKERTRIVSPNEEIEFEGFVRLNIPKLSTENSFPIYSNTLDFIKKHSPTQIEIKCETWSTLSLTKGSTKKKKAKFAERLKKKWEKIGYLWTEEIKAQPISIDFNSVIFKTLIN